MTARPAQLSSLKWPTCSLMLDDPKYIETLPKDHPLKARQNVFAFSMSCASLQTLQMLALVLAPLDQPNPGSQLYHFVGGVMEEPTFGSCNPNCFFPSVIALGDTCGISATGVRPASTGNLPAALRTETVIHKIMANLKRPGVVLKKMR